MKKHLLRLIVILNLIIIGTSSIASGVGTTEWSPWWVMFNENYYWSNWSEWWIMYNEEYVKPEDDDPIDDDPEDDEPIGGSSGYVYVPDVDDPEDTVEHTEEPEGLEEKTTMPYWFMFIYPYNFWKFFELLFDYEEVKV